MTRTVPGTILSFSTGMRVAIACLLAACAPDAAPQTAGASAVKFESLGSIDERFREASGITFHPSRQTLFVVTDEGDVGELRTDGTLVQRRHLLYEDFEGITCNPATGLLYIVIEGRDNVLEVAPDGLVVRREFDIDRHFDGKTLFAESGNGLEGIAFAPNPRHPEGGTFFLVNRSSHVEDDDDPPLLLEVELPLHSDSTMKLRGTVKAHARLDIEELSGLWYDPATNSLRAVSDDDDLVIWLTRAGEVLNTFPLGVKSPEGIAFDDAGNLYISRDPGGTVKLRPVRER